MTDYLAADIERADRVQRAADLLAAAQHRPSAVGLLGTLSVRRLKTGTTLCKKSSINAVVAAREGEKRSMQPTGFHVNYKMNSNFFSGGVIRGRDSPKRTNYRMTRVVSRV